MKVYFYKYGSLCEPDFTEALKRIGLQVDEETIEVYDKTVTPSVCVPLVSERLLNGGYTFVFTINFFPWLSDVCQMLNITYLSLIVDSPVLELFSKAIDNRVNKIFLFDEMLYNEFAHYNPDCIFHIPLCTNVLRNMQVIESYKNGTHKESGRSYESDVSFIGSTYQEKCPFNEAKLSEFDRGFVDGIIEAQLKVYGYNFIEEMLTDEIAERLLESIPDHYTFAEGFRGDNKALVAQYYLSVKVAEQERLRLLKAVSDSFKTDIYTRSDVSSMPNIHNKGFARSLDEMPLIFNQSKINLNITAKSIRSGLSLRIFDVLGSGGFLITNYQAELPEFFEIGKDLVAYESESHLKELIAYYLSHEDERQEIAQQGFMTVKKSHSIDTRIVQMLDMAFPANNN